MTYIVTHYPTVVYPGEVEAECPEADPEVVVLISRMASQGPSPTAYKAKALGKKMGGLWQINLKVEKRQIRILYAPYGTEKIVLFRIHKKSSPQEQERAYALAMKRKREYEEANKEDPKKKLESRPNDRSRSPR